MEVKKRKQRRGRKPFPGSLKKKYGRKLDSVEGCLEVLEYIFKNNGDIFTNQEFFAIDERFQDLISSVERRGVIDASKYRERYSRLVDEIDEKNKEKIIEARDPIPSRTYHRGFGLGERKRVKQPLKCFADLPAETGYLGGYDGD